MQRRYPLSPRLQINLIDARSVTLSGHARDINLKQLLLSVCTSIIVCRSKSENFPVNRF
jgi:hypothetical protein